jgi:hypothetical protein
MEKNSAKIKAKSLIFKNYPNKTISREAKNLPIWPPWARCFGLFFSCVSYLTAFRGFVVSQICAESFSTSKKLQIYSIEPTLTLKPLFCWIIINLGHN